MLGLHNVNQRIPNAPPVQAKSSMVLFSGVDGLECLWAWAWHFLWKDVVASVKLCCSMQHHCTELADNSLETSRRDRNPRVQYKTDAFPTLTFGQKSMVLLVSTISTKKPLDAISSKHACDSSLEGSHMAFFFALSARSFIHRMYG